MKKKCDSFFKNNCQKQLGDRKQQIFKTHTEQTQQNCWALIKNFKPILLNYSTWSQIYQFTL